MVPRAANNRYLHNRHHRVKGINTAINIIEIFGQDPNKSVQITETVHSEIVPQTRKKYENVDNTLKCGRNPISHMNFREIHVSRIKRENFKSVSGKY